MSDKVITLEIPETLANNAEQLGLLSRERVIAWLQSEVMRSAQHQIEPTLIEKEAELAQLLPPERLAEGLRLLHEGKPIPGLFAGKITTRDDFDDPLPDDEWGDLFQ